MPVVCSGLHVYIVRGVCRECRWERYVGLDTYTNAMGKVYWDCRWEMYDGNFGKRNRFGNVCCCQSQLGMQMMGNADDVVYNCILPCQNRMLEMKVYGSVC